MDDIKKTNNENELSEKENAVKNLKDDTKKDSKSKSNSYVGCILKLDPKKSGMLVDEYNNFVFSFFDKGKSQMKVTEDTDLTMIEPNVKHGILRVYRDGDDVTIEFGGPPKRDKYRPIVSQGIVEPDIDNKKDVSLMNVLDTYDDEEIKRNIDNIDDYKTLSRLLEFEKSGENPTSQPRIGVVDAIFNRMKSVSGISDPEEVEGSEERVTLK